MSTPYCRLHPDGFFQPGEDPTWPRSDAARNAAHACERLCPVPLDECAREALVSGTVPRQRQTRVATGVVQAGVICTGDLATHEALAAVGYPDGDGPRYVSPDDSDSEECATCKRALISPPEIVTDPDTEAMRAVKRLPLCHACYKAAWRAGDIRPVRQAPPEHCLGCGRPMSTALKRQPGQVLHDGHGRCKTCASAEARRIAAQKGAAA